MKEIHSSSSRAPTRIRIDFGEGLRKRRERRSLLNSRDLRDFSERLSRQLRLRRRYFDVTLVDDAGMAVLNRTFRGKAQSTDVLSFPIANQADCFPKSAESSGFLGDIVISIDTAMRQAAEERRPLLAEVQELILHGALHLLGYDHETDNGEMEAFERRLRKALIENRKS